MKKRRSLTLDEQHAAKRLRAMWDARKKALGLTQDKVAAQAGWSTQSVVSQYLNGVIPLNAQAALIFSKALQCSPDELFPDFSARFGLIKSPGNMAPDQRNGNVTPINDDAVRRIPVINDIQAGAAKEIVDDYAAGNGFEYLTVDAEMAAQLGPYAFGLVVTGRSMENEFFEGDRVIVDPSASIRPGDIVVAKLDQDDSATLKKYRDRGTDQDGYPVFELVPINPDYAPITVCAQNPGKIIGPVVEHRRKMRR